MDDLLIEGGADGGWKATVPLERRDRAVAGDRLVRYVVQLLRRDPRPHKASKASMALATTWLACRIVSISASDFRMMPVC